MYTYLYSAVGIGADAINTIFPFLQLLCLAAVEVVNLYVFPLRV